MSLEQFKQLAEAEKTWREAVWAAAQARIRFWDIEEEIVDNSSNAYEAQEAGKKEVVKMYDKELIRLTGESTRLKKLAEEAESEEFYAWAFLRGVERDIQENES